MSNVSQTWQYFTRWNMINPTIYLPTFERSTANLPPSTSKFLSIETFDDDREDELSEDHSALVSGRNFDNYTLKDAMKLSESGPLITSLLRNILGDFLAIEIGAGPAGFTLDLCSRKQSKVYIAYVANEDAKYQLMRNSNVYKLSNKLIVNSPFNGLRINEAFKGCLLIALNENRTPLTMTEMTNLLDFNVNIVGAVLLKADIKTGKEWNKSRLSTKYFLYTNTNKTSSMAVNEGGMKYAKALDRNLFTSSTRVPPYTKLFYSENAKVCDEDFLCAEADPDVDPEGVKWKRTGRYTKMIDSISKYNKKVKFTTVDDLKSFRDMLEALLGNLTNVKTAKELVSTKYLRSVWVRAFTHESKNYNMSYESLETLGDSIAKTAFLTYMLDIFPNLTPGELSNYFGVYLSVTWLSRFSKALGFGNWIQSEFTLNPSILEDVFESFCGALYDVGNKYELGLGQILANNLMRIIFEDIDIYSHDDIRFGDVISIVNAYHAMLRINKADWFKKNEIHTGGRFKVTLTLPMNANAPLIRYGFTDVTKLNRTYIGNSPVLGDAEREAYKGAYNALKKIGLTYQAAKDISEKLGRTRAPELANLYSKAEIKARHEGYIGIRTEKYEPDEYPIFGIIILGVRKDGTTKNLATNEHIDESVAIRPENQIRSIATALKAYLNNC